MREELERVYETVYSKWNLVDIKDALGKLNHYDLEVNIEPLISMEEYEFFTITANEAKFKLLNLVETYRSRTGEFLLVCIDVRSESKKDFAEAIEHFDSMFSDIDRNNPALVEIYNSVKKQMLFHLEHRILSNQ